MEHPRMSEIKEKVFRPQQQIISNRAQLIGLLKEVVTAYEQLEMQYRIQKHKSYDRWGNANDRY